MKTKGLNLVTVKAYKHITGKRDQLQVSDSLAAQGQIHTLRTLQNNSSPTPTKTSTGASYLQYLSLLASVHLPFSIHPLTLFYLSYHSNNHLFPTPHLHCHPAQLAILLSSSSQPRLTTQPHVHLPHLPPPHFTLYHPQNYVPYPHRGLV